MSNSGSPYSDQDLMTALRAAHESGNTDDAARIAQIIQSRQQGASPAEISAQPVQDTNPITRYAKMGVGALTQGFGQLVGLPGTIQNLGDAAAAKMQGFLGYSPEQIARYRQINSIGNLPSGSDIISGTNALGITNRPDVVPLTPGEKLYTGAMEGAGAGGPFGWMGAGIGALSGMASETAHELWLNSKIAPVAAGLVTGLGAGGVANTVENVLTGRALAKGVDTATAGLEAAKQAKAGIPDAASQIADTIHPAQTIQEAGQRLYDAAKKWAFGDPATGAKSVMQQKMDTAWQPVTQLVGTDAPVNLTNFDKALGDITTSAGKLEPAAKLLRPSAPDKLQDAVSKIKDFIQTSGGTLPEWSEVAQLRTILGDARGNPKIVEEIGQQNLSNLYRALTADMRLAAKAKGPDALKAFDNANAESSRLYGIAKDQVQPILDTTPEAAASSLLSSARKGGTDLQVLRGEMPDAVNALGAAHLRTAGKDWSKLSPEGKLALVGDPGTVQKMDGLVEAGSRVPSAKEALAAAKAKVAARTAAQGKFDPLGGIFGAGIGYDLGVLGLNAMGFQGHDILGGAAGSLLGAFGARPIGALVRGYAQNPSSLRYPAIGAVAGQAPANQLTATTLSNQR